MKKLSLVLLHCLLAMQLFAQTGIHLQEYILTPYVYNSDSVYVSFRHGPMERMVLLNPDTKEWKYLNTIDYTATIGGRFVMKSPSQGIMTSNGNIARTADGWATVSLETTGQGFDQLAVTDAGYIAYNTPSGDIHFSVDGTNWGLAYAVGFGNAGGKVSAMGNTAVLSSGNQNQNYISTDGGQTWTPTTFNQTFLGFDFIEFKVVSADTFIIARDQQIYLTYDAGTSWTEHTYGPSIVARKVAFKNSREFYLYDQISGGYYSSDAGATWQPQGIPGSDNFLFIGDDLLAWPFEKSTDNGVTWDYFLPGLVYTNNADVYFQGNKGIVGVHDGRYLTSVDQGRSFSPIKILSGANDDILAVTILNNGDFLAGDLYGQIHRSTDDGQTWTKGNSNIIPNNPYKFSWSADDSVVVASLTGQPVFSFDHGQTFTSYTMGGGAHAQTVKPNGQIIDVGAWFDYQLFQDVGWRVYEVSEAGNKTNVDSFLVSGEGLVDVYMVGNSTGYIITYDITTKQNRIYKSSNGFTSAGTTLLSTIDPLVPGVINYERAQTQFQSFGTDTLMLIGDGNTKYHYSYDGGATWNAAGLDIHATYPNYYPSLRMGHFFTPTTFVFGLRTSGLYLNTTGATGPVAIDEPALQQQLTAHGSLNVYPNPMSDQIQIALQDHEILDLAIYNSAGARMKQINGVRASTVISIGDLPAGIYFLRSEGETLRGAVAKLLKQ